MGEQVRKRFEMTENHVKLLRRMYVGWQDCETGAPEIDPKRPYGNSSVACDVAKIIGEPIQKDDDGYLNEKQSARLLRLHSETETALQIVLVTGAFEPGMYEQREEYITRSWAKVPT